MKKSFYLIGSVLGIVLFGMLLVSGCSRASGNSQTQSNNSPQNSKTQESNNSSTTKTNAGTKAIVSDGVQTVNTTLDQGIYAPIIVQTGVPVKWTITANKGDLNSCNNKMVIRSYGVEKQLNVGENAVEFTPTKSGTIVYSCWMGMVGSTITVVDDINQ